MSNQFSRSELIFGSQSTKVLSRARVAVFGLGGVGGHALEALARMGVGHLDIIDSDKVSLSNINRQLVALHSTVGQLKTDVFKKRIEDINPLCQVVCHNVFYLPDNTGGIDLGSYDYVVDAIDTVSAKLYLASKCSELGVRLISSMGTGNKTEPTMLKVADIYDTKVCPLARAMRSELRKRGVESLKVVYSEEEPITGDKRDGNAERPLPGSTAFVPSVAGLIIASEVIKDLVLRGNI